MRLPQTLPGHFRGIPTTKFLYVCFLFIVPFVLLMQGMHCGIGVRVVELNSSSRASFGSAQDWSTKAIVRRRRGADLPASCTQHSEGTKHPEGTQLEGERQDGSELSVCATGTWKRSTLHNITFMLLIRANFVRITTWMQMFLSKAALQRKRWALQDMPR